MEHTKAWSLLTADCKTIGQLQQPLIFSCISDEGSVNPPRVRGKGQKGKGQGKDFLTLNKPLTLVKGQGFSRGFSGVLFL